MSKNTTVAANASGASQPTEAPTHSDVKREATLRARYMKQIFGDARVRVEVPRGGTSSTKVVLPIGRRYQIG